MRWGELQAQSATLQFAAHTSHALSQHLPPLPFLGRCTPAKLLNKPTQPFPPGKFMYINNPAGAWPYPPTLYTCTCMHTRRRAVLPAEPIAEEGENGEGDVEAGATEGATPTAQENDTILMPDKRSLAASLATLLLTLPALLVRIRMCLQFSMR